MAALPKSSAWTGPSIPIQVVKRLQQLEFSGVFRGHELTRKDRRLSSGLVPLDALIDGGIPRGRISEITGRAGSGKTSIAASFAAFATRRGEVAAWLDASGSFDPESMAAAGLELRRMLWASMRRGSAHPCSPLQKGRPVGIGVRSIVKAAELVLEAGGFGLVVVDFGEAPRALTYASSLRIARAAERSGAAVIVIAPWRMCGTFAALSIAASRAETSFSRLAPGSPVMFDGLAVDAMVARNKMGGTGRHVRVRALVDPIPNPFEAHPHSDRKEFPVRISASS
ncbi:ATPase domain-containing protein [Candidatus Binatus sp.]|uniref:ATPase domain-containing protein n=2 Tax=Candidatus Binatus sp. TaxID=2811406 RepID=UPI003CC6B578